MTTRKPPTIPIPKGWPSHVKSAVLHIISLAHFSITHARGWTLKETADAFLVSSPTVGSWSKRVDEEGSKALLQLREPVNRFPDFVRYAVQRLKAPIGALASSRANSGPADRFREVAGWPLGKGRKTTIRISGCR